MLENMQKISYEKKKLYLQFQDENMWQTGI